jgi:hypothetical protein
MMNQSERNTEQQSGQIYYTLFGTFTALLCVLPANAKSVRYAEPKPFSWAKTGIFWLFPSSSFHVQGHIVSTARDDLKANYLLRNRRMISLHAVHAIPISLSTNKDPPLKYATHNTPSTPFSPPPHRPYTQMPQMLRLLVLDNIRVWGIPKIRAPKEGTKGETRAENAIKLLSHL